MKGEAAAGVTRMFPIAVDYGRFSNVVQELGDSKGRQKSLADAWSERTGIPIDLRLADEGVSGRDTRRRTDDSYDLTRFLKFVQSGRVQPGDYLLLENLDRLSREEEVPATHLLTSILVAGVKVVQLAPQEMELTAKSDMFQIFRAVMELSRGHGESERKHQVCAASYASNRSAAAEGKESYQGVLPSWLRREGRGKGARRREIATIPERVAVVREIFRLAAGGLGYTAIVRRLTAEAVPAFGGRVPRIDPETGRQARSRRGRLRWMKGDAEDFGTGRWTRSYVVSILRGREAVGELATHTGQILPIPAVVTQDEWLAAQAGRAERTKHRGRTRKDGKGNLFTGLLREAGTGDTFYSIPRQGRGRHWRVIVNAAGKNSEGACNSFPEAAFEEAVLRCLKEIDPRDVSEQQKGPDRVDVLSGRLEEVQGQIREMKAELKSMTKKPRSALEVMAELEEEEMRLEEERRQAQQEAAHPLSEAWGQAKTLMDVIDTAEKRLRLRSLLRRVVEEIRVLIVPRGWDRVAAVQVWFVGSQEARSYLIAHKKARVSRLKGETGPDVTVVRQFRDGEDADLRRPEDVIALRERLRALDLAGV